MTAAELDMDKLHEFVGKMLGDLGGAVSVPTVRIGIRLGLFDALAEAPATSQQLAERTGLAERTMSELLRGSASTVVAVLWLAAPPGVPGVLLMLNSFCTKGAKSVAMACCTGTTSISEAVG